LRTLARQGKLYDADGISSGSDDAPLVPDVTLELHIDND